MTLIVWLAALLQIFILVFGIKKKGIQIDGFRSEQNQVCMFVSMTNRLQHYVTSTVPEEF